MSDPFADPAAGAVVGAVPAADANRNRAIRWWLAGAGSVVVAWGSFALWKAFDIEHPNTYTPMGPRVFPIIISVGLIGIGALFLFQVVSGKDRPLEFHLSEELRTAQPLVAGLLLALLIVYATLLERLGYVVSTSLFFPATARVLGSRQPVRDVVVGVAIAVIAFVVFTRLLSINLPTGVLGDVI